MSTQSSTASDLPRPEKLSVYTFVDRYSATTLPLKLALLVCMLVFAHIAAASYWFEVGRAQFKGEEGWAQWWMIDHFDLDTESGFGTYYSSMALLFIGRLLWQHAKIVKGRGEIWCWWWFVLAIGFHWLSIDEVIAAHEILNHYKGRTAEAENIERVRWTLEGAWVAGAVGLAFLPFLWQLRWRLALFAMVGGSVYLGGALGVEQATDKYQDWGHLGTTEYHMWVALEEGMEMMGPLIFLSGLMHHLARDKERSAAES